MSPLTQDLEPAVVLDLSSITKPARKRLTEADVAQDASGLQVLAENGSWTSFSVLAQNLALVSDAKPHQILQFNLCHVLGLLRRRDFTSAQEYGKVSRWSERLLDRDARRSRTRLCLLVRYRTAKADDGVLRA